MQYYINTTLRIIQHKIMSALNFQKSSQGADIIIVLIYKQSTDAK